jgi:hypothetical protein
MNTNDPFVMNRKQSLRSWILGEMMTGAGYAAIVAFGTLLLIWVISLVGLLLPEESRQTPDPMPRSSIEMPADPLRAVA